MKKLSRNRRLTSALTWLFLGLLLPCFGYSAPIPPVVINNTGGCGLTSCDQTHSEEFDLVFEGDYLSMYTSGRLLKQKKHLKSSVWNVPSRKLKEMWVKRGEDSPLIRLDPKTFRRQLVELLPNFPEIHKAISHKHFTYKGLSHGIVELNNHMAKVVIVRQQKLILMDGK